MVGIGGLMIVGAVAYDAYSPKPEVVALDSVVAFPDVRGMVSEKAQTVIKAVLPASLSTTQFDRAAHDYGIAHRCSWTDPNGEVSRETDWPVTSVALVLPPDDTPGSSLTKPVRAGAKFLKDERLVFELHTEKPARVWCKP